LTHNSITVLPTFDPDKWFMNKCVSLLSRYGTTEDDEEDAVVAAAAAAAAAVAAA